MSYCRFSSDCYGSDVYVYESCHGPIVIEVASSRYQSAEPRPVYPEAGTVGELADYHHATQAWVQGAHLVPIGLPNDGDHLEADGPEEAAELLERLQTLGYHIPAGVIEVLREEAE